MSSKKLTPAGNLSFILKHGSKNLQSNVKIFLHYAKRAAESCRRSTHKEKT